LDIVEVDEVDFLGERNIHLEECITVTFGSGKCITGPDGKKV